MDTCNEATWLAPKGRPIAQRLGPGLPSDAYWASPSYTGGVLLFGLAQASNVHTVQVSSGSSNHLHATGADRFRRCRLLYSLDPRVAGNYPSCPFLFFTGCYCPGCGTLRAINRLLHGDAISAIDYNPLPVLTLPLLTLSYIGAIARAFGRPLIPHFVMPSSWIWAFLIAVITFWVGRNIPYYPFNILAP